MKHVIGSCAAFKWFLNEQDSEKARALRDDFRMEIVELIAPDVFPVEIVHALTRAERANRITSDEGAELVADLFQILPVLHQSLTLLPRAYELSSQIRIGVYDCLYIALAEQEQCKVVSAEIRLLNHFSAMVISLDSL